MHGCPQAQCWLSLKPCLNIWMSELLNRGRQLQRGQREHLGRLPWGEWVCSSAGRLTHFIISLSHAPRIHCVHEQAKAIVKQAHVRTRHGATGGGIYGRCACLAVISALDKNGWRKINFTFAGTCSLFVHWGLFLNANVGAAYWENWVNIKNLSKIMKGLFMIWKKIWFAKRKDMWKK